MNEETMALLENIVRIGRVSSVNSSKRQARVIFGDKGLVSGWLYVLQHNGANVTVGSDDDQLKIWMPNINDRVLCLYIPVFNGDGFVLGGIP